MGLGPLHPGQEGGEGNGGKDGGRRVGKGMGRKGRGRGNKHTRFKTCGAAHERTHAGVQLQGGATEQFQLKSDRSSSTVKLLIFRCTTDFDNEPL